MKNNKLEDLFKRYHSAKVAAKLVKKLSEMTPEQIGRSILSTKMPGQRIVNLERLKH